MASDSVPSAGHTVETSWEQIAKTRELDIYEQEVGSRKRTASETYGSIV
jgi:hypothetical protein